MQVFVTFPDLGLPAVSFTAGADSFVGDVLAAAAEEWDVDPGEVEVSLAGELLCETGRLTQHGIGANTELEMRKKQFRLFGKSWFVDEEKTEKMLARLEGNEEYLFLDTPTFSDNGILNLRSSLVPQAVKGIWFRNSNSGVTSIANTFLSECDSVTAANFSDLTTVTAVGNSFLAGSNSITSLDLSGFSSVTTIGFGFLANCTSITTLDLSGLTSITAIGNYFMLECSLLTTLDLSCLSSVPRVGSHFLSCCSSITTLDLSCLGSVTSVGDYFLYRCSSVTSVDLSGLGSVSSIGDYFLSDCSSITSADLSALSSVVTIGEGLLHTNELQSVQLPENNSSLFAEQSKVVKDLMSISQCDNSTVKDPNN